MNLFRITIMTVLLLSLASTSHLASAAPANVLPPAPVSLLSFTAALANDKVVLTWSANQDTLITYYSIERSYDSKTFDQAAIVFTADEQPAINNYSFKDGLQNTVGNTIYYRLKMVDKENNFTYSEIRSIVRAQR